MNRLLAVRLDSIGDVLVTGPAVRAMAGSGAAVSVLAGPRGAEAAALLPGVEQVLTWPCPWIEPRPAPVDPDDVGELVERLRKESFDAALVFTSFHQSPLPTALLLRLAGVPWVGAISGDYPGALLDLRHRLDDDVPEPVRARSLAEAAGYHLPAGDRGMLAVRDDLPDARATSPSGRYVVVHPGTSVPARAWPAERFADTVDALAEAGWSVAVTGTKDERDLCARVAGTHGLDVSGRTPLPRLAALLRNACAVVVANTGPAHLAAAVGTPVVSLFAPTVPAARWAPYGVPVELLGDQHAACRATRATQCPVPGHPCLTSVRARDAVAAVERITSRPGAEAR